MKTTRKILAVIGLLAAILPIAIVIFIGSFYSVENRLMNIHSMGEENPGSSKYSLIQVNYGYPYYPMATF